MTETETGPRESHLWIDAERCIGCYACEAACIMEHDLPVGPRPIKVIQVGPLEMSDRLILSYQPATCNHCLSPACVMACPTGAMRKQDDDMVISDPKLCIGCRTCAVSCPFGIPQLHPGIGKITKCDNCRDRVLQGLSPACVLACPTGALSFVAERIQSWRSRETAAMVMRRFSPRR